MNATQTTEADVTYRVDLQDDSGTWDGLSGTENDPHDSLTSAIDHARWLMEEELPGSIARVVEIESDTVVWD
jgi:hypothetical protein